VSFAGKLNVRVSQKEAEEKPNTTRTFTLKRGNEVEVPLCGTIQVAVTDTGAGMSGEQLAELFRDGVQFNVNDLQSGQGSGLGLYIAKGIVDQHGGKLTTYSKGIGHGTTFTMTLPLFLIPDKTPKTEEPYQNSGAATTGSIQVENKEVLSSYLRILVVDDAPTNRKLLRRLLENHGHSITEAEDGLDAVQKMQEGRSDGKPFDSILLDYEMPHMNGPDSCRKMREMGCDSFIVGVTGNVMAQDVTYFKECGANGVLAKPFRLAELDQMLLEYGVLGSHPSDGIENLGDGGK
jgi:CheY-like chemotaxis protein